VTVVAAADSLHDRSIRPRLRRRELVLLVVVAVALLTGWVTVASTAAGAISLGDPTVLVLYLAGLLAVHLLFVLTRRRTDQILLPAVGLLGGLSLLLMARLPQELVQKAFGPYMLGLAPMQLAWLLVALAVTAVLAIAVRSDNWLRLYKYTWAAAGIGLLLLVFVIGREEPGGARLSICAGPVCGQPSELLKVILVIFLAGYLADNRVLLATRSWRVGPLRLPPLPYLLPMMAMWGLALAVVVVQRDLGAALLFFLVFLAMLYIATGRALYVLTGLAAFLAGGAVLYQVLPYVQERVNTWLNPFADPLGAGYQTVRGLYAFGRGGFLGTGLGAGLPAVGSIPAIPAIHTDFAFTALAEELGLLGALAILTLYLVIAQRGMRVAATAADDFRSLLASGLTLVILVQAAIIVGGNAKLIPLTGITLPFISYGGSSLLANAVVVGLLLALSDRGVEPPPPPRPRRGLVSRGAAP
jgi:cell division protein FtsW (lipid II flippase)